MTTQTLWIPLVYNRAMRLPVTLPTGYDLLVDRMAFSTCQFRMFSLMVFEQIKFLFVTSSTHLIVFYILRIGNFQRCMGRVTFQTLLSVHGYHRAVRFVTLCTIRYPAMFLRMTGRALQIRMVAGVLRHTLCHLAMAYPTLLFQLIWFEE